MLFGKICPFMLSFKVTLIEHILCNIPFLAHINIPGKPIYYLGLRYFPLLLSSHREFPMRTKM